MKQHKIGDGSETTVAEINALARQILDKEWLQQEVTQDELDTGRLLGERSIAS